MALEYVLANLDETKPYQTFRCVLDDVTYEMTWQWNTRGEFWTVTVGAVGDTPIIKYKVTSFSNPMEVYGYNENLPQGDLFVMSILNPKNRIAIDSIGEDKVHWFMYTTTD
jgi:hypothetical protein